ncbi:MAG: 50S ribosomal protein L1 [Candidatus Omnitrophota bacterium]
MGKRIIEARKLVESNKLYNLKEAVGVLKKAAPAKFDESIDIAMKLNVNSKSLSQPIRGAVVLPKGTGKKIRVAVFCKGENVSKAKEAGADVVGDKDLVDKIREGFLDFDVCVATPDVMKDIAILGKVLGPRGLMPSPKAGTVTPDVVKAINDVKAGKVEFKMDKLGCITKSVGRFSFSEEDIYQNLKTFINAVVGARPGDVKGKYIKSLAISSTMGPGVRIDTSAY